MLAVTATATRQVRDDITRQLELGPELTTLVRGFERPNLRLSVAPVSGGRGEKLRALTRLLEDGPKGAGIIYCATRKNCERLARDLAAKKPRTHAALLEVFGLGDRKAAQFGDAIIGVIALAT